MASIKALEATIQRLEMQVAVEKEKSSNLQQYMNRASSETQDIIAKFRKFCTVILEKSITSGDITSGEISSLSLDELLEAAKGSYHKEEVKTQEIYKRFASKLEEKNQQLYANKLLISQLQTKLARCTDYSNLDNPQQDPSAAKAAVTIQTETAQTPVQQATVPSPALNTVVEQEVDDIVVQKESVDDQVSTYQKEANKAAEKPARQYSNNLYGGHDLNKIEAGLTDLEWYIIEFVGTTGISEKPIILDNLMAKFGEIASNTKIRKALKSLSDKQVLIEYKVQTGFRWFNLDELSVDGELLFKGRFGKDAVESEMSKIRRAHDNIDHGYGIKDTAKLLSEKLGYSSVTIDRQANFIKLDETHSSIPDIIAVKDGKTFYFEYECANHHSNDFDDKCHKLSMITDSLYFICPNNEACAKLEKQIKHWIETEGGREKLLKANITVSLTTTTALGREVWITIFDMESDEPKRTNELYETNETIEVAEDASDNAKEENNG